MNKLQLNELASYFPYSIKAYFKQKNTKTCRKMVIGTVSGIYSNASIVCHDTVNATPDKFFIILKPLSDFENSGFDIQDEIEVSRMIRGDYIHSFRHGLITLLLENHYDIFGLIDKKLAINANALFS
jgi:hypothetical protein